MRILVVEDELKTAEYLHQGLTESGYIVDRAITGADGLHLARQHVYDLVILDVNLPELDGWGVLERLRQSSNARVMMLTARGRLADKIRGLDLGADDYLAKPFSVLELMARVKALFRRQEAMSQNLRMEAGIITVHGVEIDPLAREVRLHGKSLDLTPREFDLLYFFARHPGEVFSRQALLDQVWGYQHEGYEHTVNSHINRLRTKIEKDAAEPEIILTVWGRGYKLAAVNAEHQP